jgi:uroporphyrinogen-III synthase
MRRLAVLRPEPGASETVARARELGLDPLAIPLFDIEPLDWAHPDAQGFDGLLLTSANAVNHAGDGLRLLRGLPVYAVGDATATAARDAGFGIAATGDGGVDRLLGSIDPDLRLLHLCGEEHKSPSTETQRITAVAVYRAAVRVGVDASAAEGGIVLVHSPRAGRRLAELITRRAATAIVAISVSAGAAVGEGWDRVDIADQPTDEALLALAASLCNKTVA